MSVTDSSRSALIVLALGLASAWVTACTVARRVEREPDAADPRTAANAGRGGSHEASDAHGSAGSAADQTRPDDAPLLPDAGSRVEADGCFSPAVDAQNALEPGVWGCECKVENARACVAGIALVCAQVEGAPGARFTRWVGLPKETCDLDPSCPVANRRSDALACLNEYASCNQREDAAFCGARCRGPLDCALVSCDDYEEPGFECDGTGGPWEGVCDVGTDSLVRYRAESGRGTRYWDLNDGKLRAAQLASDTKSFCGGSDLTMMLGDISVIQRCTVVTNDSTAICSKDRCSDGVAQRVEDSCVFELGGPLPAEFCVAHVQLNGQGLTCRHPDGWRRVDRFKIRLDGAACELVQSGEP
ncbi:MAG TPA: hypothetical protein VK509_02255, partial [Polyangiales bacterium]|nr:hypothetical protein [Polyangiales bacterium]